jgi:hypothetical protein
MIDNVLPLTSTPTYLLRSHFPSLRLAQLAGMFRAMDIIKATVCSAAELILPEGELTTTIPSFVASWTSIYYQ